MRAPRPNANRKLQTYTMIRFGSRPWDNSGNPCQKAYIYIYTRLIFCTKNIHHCEPYICNIKISKNIGLPENRLPRIPWFIIISNRKIAIRGYTVYWYTTFSGTPKSCSVGYILISPWYLRKKLRKNINSCGWLYIYIYICVYISICGFLQYLLIQIQWSWLGIQPNWFYISWSDIYIYIIPLYSDKNSQRYIKITWNPYWLLLQSNPHALTPAAPQPRWPPLRRLAAARAWPGHSQGKFCYNLGTSIPIFENVQMCMYLYIHIYIYIYRYNI